MSYSILLKINEVTHGQFESIRQKLNAGADESQSRILGEVLSEIACEIVEQVFSVLLIQNRQPNQLAQKYTHFKVRNPLHFEPMRPDPVDAR